tara:strand:- start:4732 stop:5370 length:639 start_codon:yes stop_codon:yes gene_type:complete
MSWLDETLSGIFGTDDKQTNTLIGLGGSLLLNQTGLGQAQIPQTGYQGSIPDYTIQRERVPRTYDPNRRPGSGGQRYFTQTQFVPTEDITPAEPMSAEGLAALNEANPARQERKPVTTMAKGGIAELEKGRYLTGETDGMADEVRANIDGTQEARLSDGEYVIPADVVSHLGNGNSDAGAKVLDKMLDRVRKARTGNEKQGKEINPKKFLPA